MYKRRQSTLGRPSVGSVRKYFIGSTRFRRELSCLGEANSLPEGLLSLFICIHNFSCSKPFLLIKETINIVFNWI